MTHDTGVAIAQHQIIVKKPMLELKDLRPVNCATNAEVKKEWEIAGKKVLLPYSLDILG